MADSGSSVSYMSVSTPDVTKSVTIETQYTYPWEDQEIIILNEHRQYHLDMLKYIKDLKHNGPSGLVLPKKPKVDIKLFLPNNKKKSKLLSGHDLHKYLVKNIVTSNKGIPLTVSEAGENLFTSLENMIDNLKIAYKFLQNQNCSTLCTCLDFGEWLNIAFELHNIEKQAGKINSTWKEWLETNVGIQDSYARKLREITKILGNYPRFRKLGLSFSEIYNRRKQIQGMLITYCTVSEYWKQVL